MPDSCAKAGTGARRKKVARGPADHTAADERGAAVLDFVLVGSVMTLLFVAVVQLMLVLHVRNTLIDAAASGARYGAMADRTAADAEDRTTELITGALNKGFAEDITTAVVEAGGIRTLEVTVTAPMPVVGLLGAGGLLKVTGHAVLH